MGVGHVTTQAKSGSGGMARINLLRELRCALSPRLLVSISASLATGAK